MGRWGHLSRRATADRGSGNCAEHPGGSSLAGSILALSRVEVTVGKRTVFSGATLGRGAPSSAERAEGQPSTAPSTYIHSTHPPPTHAFCQIGSPDIPGHKALPTSTLRSRTLLAGQTKTRKRALTQAQDTTSKPPSCRSRERLIPPRGSG